MKYEAQLAILSNLHPQTVLSLVEVPFLERALALPGVQEASQSITDVSVVDSEGLESEIDVRAAMRIEPDREERMVVMDKVIIAGGLCDDDGGFNPLEDGDGNGDIYHRGRRGQAGELEQFYKATGHTSEGEKDLDAPAVMECLGTRVWDAIKTDLGMLLGLGSMLKRHGKDREMSVESAIRSAIKVADSDEDIAEALTGCRVNSLDFPDQERIETLWALAQEKKEAAWDEAMADGRIGNPMAVLLDIYEHGGIAYSVSGEGMQCRWDTSDGAAVWVPDACAEENIRYSVMQQLGMGNVKWFGAAGSKEDPLNARYSIDGGKTWQGPYSTWGEAMTAMAEASGQSIDAGRYRQLLRTAAEKYCRSIMETYNDWLSGDVSGIVVYVLDRTTGEELDQDEVWGFIGSNHAEESLDAEILSKVVQYGTKPN